MEQEDLKLLTDWFEANKDHKLNFIEKEAIKMAVRKADTVGDLLKTALGLLKKKNNGGRQSAQGKTLTIHGEKGIIPFILRRS